MKHGWMTEHKDVGLTVIRSLWELTLIHYVTMVTDVVLKFLSSKSFGGLVQTDYWSHLFPTSENLHF